MSVSGQCTGKHAKKRNHAKVIMKKPNAKCIIINFDLVELDWLTEFYNKGNLSYHQATFIHFGFPVTRK